MMNIRTVTLRRRAVFRSIADQFMHGTGCDIASGFGGVAVSSVSSVSRLSSLVSRRRRRRLSLSLSLSLSLTLSLSLSLGS